MDTTEKTPRRSRRLKVTAGATAVMIAGSLGAVALFDNAGAAPGDNAKYTITLNAASANTGNTNSVPALPVITDTRTGTAVVQVKGKTAQVCVLIKKMGINANPVPAGDVPIAAHIHGVADTTHNAGILIPLNPPVLKGKKYDKSKTCVSGVDAALIAALKATPNQYYVNVHTVAFPGGALRGQLAP